MYRVIDLDQSGKEADGYVFLITLGNEKVGLSDQEIAEMIRTRHGVKGATKKAVGKAFRGGTASDMDAVLETEPVTEGLPLA